MVKHVIVGLGNPGPQFERTRHNAGFDVMRTISGNVRFERVEALQADVAIVDTPAGQIAVACPTTGMNSSGEAAKALLDHYGLSASQLLMVYDDVSLPMGKLRFQHHGGAGGHHGIESTIEQLGTKEFDRLKVGVGPDPGGAERYKFVLAQIADELMPLFIEVLALSAEAAVHWLTNGPDSGMRTYNGRNLRQ